MKIKSITMRFLTSPEWCAKVNAYIKAKGLSFSEFARRACDEYMEKHP